jgi:hypothetical protein
MGDRGHRKGQLRVLGSPSARRTIIGTEGPRAGWPPGGGGGECVCGRDFVDVAEVPSSYISQGIRTKTGLQAPRANR